MAGRRTPHDALTRASIVGCAALLMGGLCAGGARAQDAEPDGGSAPDGGVPQGSVPQRSAPDGGTAIPTLPAPTLEEPPPGPPEPLPEPEEEEPPVILHRISLGDHPEWEIEEGQELPRDVAFEVPGDARTQQQSGQIRLPSEDEQEPPPTFGVGLGAGFARLLGAVPFDYLRLEQRFEARIPEFPALRVGAAVTEMINDQYYLVGGGARLGLGATWCDAGWVACEGVAIVQPGVMGGDILGVRFDLHAGLDLRFHFRGLLELSVSGGYSLLGETSLFHVGGEGAIVF